MIVYSVLTTCTWNGDQGHWAHPGCIYISASARRNGISTARLHGLHLPLRCFRRRAVRRGLRNMRVRTVRMLRGARPPEPDFVLPAAANQRGIQNEGGVVIVELCILYVDMHLHTPLLHGFAHTSASPHRITFDIPAAKASSRHTDGTGGLVNMLQTHCTHAMQVHGNATTRSSSARAKRWPQPLMRLRLSSVGQKTSVATSPSTRTLRTAMAVRGSATTVSRVTSRRIF